MGGKKACISKVESAEVPIACNLMVGSSEVLFISVAKELAKFISTEDESFRAPDGRRKELSFTVLFPVDQASDSSDICIEWTKGFSIKDTIEFISVSCILHVKLNSIRIVPSVFCYSLCGRQIIILYNPDMK
ncbi:hypothetical protein AAC387_Pa02g3296 [Persea americana]